MNKARQVAAIGEIVEIRRIQRIAAEARVLSSAAQVLSLEDKRSRSADQQRANEAGWARLIAEHSPDPRLARLWSTAVARGERDLGLIDKSIREALDQQNLTRSEWANSDARHGVASSLYRTAHRCAERRSDELHLNNMADRGARVEQDL